MEICCVCAGGKRLRYSCLRPRTQRKPSTILSTHLHISLNSSPRRSFIICAVIISLPQLAHYQLSGNSCVSGGPLGFIICRVLIDTSWPCPDVAPTAAGWAGTAPTLSSNKHTHTSSDSSPSFHIATQPTVSSLSCLFIALELPFSWWSLLWTNRLRSVQLWQRPIAKSYMYTSSGAVIEWLPLEMVSPTSGNK